MRYFRRIIHQLHTGNGELTPVAAAPPASVATRPSARTARQDGAEPTFSRLVLVAPFWAAWTDLGQACDAYRKLVDQLSTAATDGVASFIHDLPREADDRKLDEKRAAAGADGEHLYPVWHWLDGRTGGHEVGWNDVGSSAAEAARDTVCEGLGLCEQGWIPEVAAARHELVADQLNLFGVRFFFDHVHFDQFLCAAVGPDQVPPYTVCIDLRFDVKDDTCWTFATLSLWSDRPRHDDIAPQDAPDPSGGRDFSLGRLDELRAGFESITRRFECFLHSPAPVGGEPRRAPDPGRHGLGWDRPRLEVFDGHYQPPRFWFAVPSGGRNPRCRTGRRTTTPTGSSLRSPSGSWS